MRTGQSDSSALYELTLDQRTPPAIAVDGEAQSATTEEQTNWQFTGSAGQVVTIVMDAADFNAVLELKKIDGSALTSADYNGTGMGEQINSYILPEEGTYLIAARGYSGAQGSYT
ncbi:MAG: hypothetical protein R2932_03565 [Caldilineaceae bacterium]